MFKRLLKLVLLSAVIFFSLLIVIYRQDYSMLVIMLIVIGLLLLFSLIAKLLEKKKIKLAREIKDRTVTWWWMAAVFMVALSTHKIISFCFMGFLCFAALKEYFSLLPAKETGGNKNLSVKDNLPVFLCYLAILVTAYLAYIQWYGFYIILVPVYTFLLIPIIFVLQNRTAGTVSSLGMISVGLMFFVFNLGHSLFMVNMGAMVLLFCFFLTETRDLLSFWVGKALARQWEKNNESSLLRVLNTKIAESVSPKKTWGAGIITTLLIMGLALAFTPIMPKFPDGKLSYGYAMILGLAIGFFGLMGDLVFSMIKRDIGIKDSGTALPGHGGVIDRVDSLIFTIPITFHLITWRYF
jgi:phosphatidate cytidylyltransferase